MFVEEWSSWLARKIRYQIRYKYGCCMIRWSVSAYIVLVIQLYVILGLLRSTKTMYLGALSICFKNTTLFIQKFGNVSIMGCDWFIRWFINCKVTEIEKIYDIYKIVYISFWKSKNSDFSSLHDQTCVLHEGRYRWLRIILLSVISHFSKTLSKLNHVIKNYILAVKSSFSPLFVSYRATTPVQIRFYLYVTS